MTETELVDELIATQERFNGLVKTLWEQDIVVTLTTSTSTIMPAQVGILSVSKLLHGGKHYA